MKVGICDSADIDGIVTEIDNTPIDDVVLMFIVAAYRPAKNLMHEQASILARSGKVGRRKQPPFDSLLAPFTKHKGFGLRESLVGIGNSRLPVYCPICHLKGLSKKYSGPPRWIGGAGYNNLNPFEFGLLQGR